MGTLRVLRHKVPTQTQQILALLAPPRGGPLHYTILAKRLHADPSAIQRTCWRLWQAGRLCWYGDGVYGAVGANGETMALPARPFPGKAAGGSA